MSCGPQTGGESTLPGWLCEVVGIELLTAAVPLLRDAELHTYPRLGHSLKPVLDDALDRAAAFLRRVGETRR